MNTKTVFKVGDLVYVPNAYDVLWKPWLTQVEDIVDGKYVCEVKYKNYASFDGGVHAVKREFDNVFEDPLSCQEHIYNYYYGGLCSGCQYEEDAGTILTCADCKHNIKHKSEKPIDWTVGRCEFSGIRVWTGAKPTIGMEICKKYSPTLPQHQKWDWDRYEDLLKNCEFNKECKHHVESCHKTCSYEKYMNELIRIPYSCEYGGRNVKHVFIKRSEWVNREFRDKDDGIKCWGVAYAPEYTKSGKVKKGTVNNVEMFEERKVLKQCIKMN